MAGSGRWLAGLAGAVALLWTTPAAAAEAAAAPRPAMWLLADEDTKIYLFGTIHILPPGLEWRSAALDRIVAEADELVLEVAEDSDAMEQAAIMPLVTLGKQVPILSRVSLPRRKPLRALIEGLGLPVETFDGMQTWAAAMTISITALSYGYGVDPASGEELTGVEDALRADFTAAGRPISGVETGPQQIGFLSGLPLRVQREMLESMVEASANGDSDPTGPTDESWLLGDVETIGAEMREMPPELYDALLTRRNAAWTGWLIDRLDRPGTVLFAVGAGHLAGADSVQTMLARQGYEVRRLD